MMNAGDYFAITIMDIGVVIGWQDWGSGFLFTRAFQPMRIG